MKKTPLLSLAVFLCSLLSHAPVMAADVSLKNETDILLKKIACYPLMGTKPNSIIAQNLAAQGQVLISAEKLKQDLCDRFVVSTSDDKVWQFFIATKEDKKNISIHFSPLNRNSLEKTQPSVIYEVGTDLRQEPAGLPFSGAWQLIGGGRTVEEWKDLMPQGMKLGDLQKNVLSFGGHSWDYAKNGIEIKDGVVTGMQFTLPLITAVLLPMTESFKSGDLSLQSIMVNGEKKDIQGSGQEAVINAFSLYNDAQSGNMVLKSDYATVTIIFPGNDTIEVKITK